ncbi:uncharacterized protein LOC110675456 [Aedes aegypti]|uniref:Uncharacterized protein n=1 Tax=Aedes aegypti TaxID=7159 RepID=A0A6I8U307_AEDAE|nr:uncharacterized protein LOC110675456 [Aedes aegypti]
MKLWVTVVCALAFLGGGAFTMYASISIGSEGLQAMALSLKSIEPVSTAYYKNLNNARNKVMPKIDNLIEHVNSTYAVMNDSYGATQPNMMSVLNNLDMFTRQFYYGEQQVISTIGNDLSRLQYELQQTMDQIMQSYNNLLNGFSYQQNAESCSTQFATVATSFPNQLTKFGTCLQTEVDTVPTVATALVEIFNLIKSDFTSLTKQLKICAATSSNCINEYFNGIYMELDRINMELSMATSLIHNYQYDAMERNQFCGELIKYNAQDISQNMISQFSSCIYPPMM